MDNKRGVFQIEEISCQRCEDREKRKTKPEHPVPYVDMKSIQGVCE